MTIHPDILRALAEAGATPDMIIAAIEADYRIEQARLATEPSPDDARERKRMRDRAYRRRIRQESPHVASDNVECRQMSPGRGDSGATPKENPPDPKKKNINIPPVGSPADPLPTRSERGTRLPAGFLVPPEWISWAMAQRNWSATDAADEAGRFCRHWQSKAGKGARKVDWEKTWRNWVKSSYRPNGPKPMSESEQIASFARRAEMYERMGRTDDAAECRRMAEAVRAKATGPPAAQAQQGLAGVEAVFEGRA